MKVLWAIEHPVEYKYAIKFLNGLGKVTKVDLHILGVISIDSEFHPVIPFIPEHQFNSIINQHKEKFEKLFSGLRKKIKVPCQWKVVSGSFARTVNEYRKKVKPSLTIIETEPLSYFPFSIGSDTASLIKNLKEDFVVLKGSGKFPPKKIALPVDMSPFSISALRRGFELAKKFNTSLDIFTVVETRNLAFPQAVIKDMIKIAERELKAKIHKKYGKVEGIKVRISAVEGKNAEEGIVEFLHRNKSHLVVMGKHGYTFIDNFLGTVTEKIIRYSPVPVWVIGNPRRKLF